MTSPTQKGEREEALKACPFCGSADCRVIGGPGTRGGPKYWAGCDHCSGRAWGDTEAEAIATWNRRHSSKAEGEMREALEAARLIVAELEADPGEGLTEAGAMMVNIARALLALQEALEGIRYHSENQDMSHRTFRIKARECADAALTPKEGA